jgi:hypothetical protein
MNKLKRIFSPSALAATLATGMLLHATATTLAEGWCQSAFFGAGNCTNPQLPEAMR